MMPPKNPMDSWELANHGKDRSDQWHCEEDLSIFQMISGCVPNCNLRTMSARTSAMDRAYVWSKPSSKRHVRLQTVRWPIRKGDLS
jgi:hypothetical protein